MIAVSQSKTLPSMEKKLCTNQLRPWHDDALFIIHTKYDRGFFPELSFKYLYKNDICFIVQRFKENYPG